MMEKSFFLKYYDYKIGIRYTIEDFGSSHKFLVEYDEEPREGDERFVAGFNQFTDLKERLKKVYGDEEGESLFLHFVQELFLYAERVEKNRRRREKKKNK